MSQILKVLKLYEDAKLPEYATPGSACMDLFAYQIERGPINPYSIIIRTGICVEIPEGWAMMIYSRSGHGFNQDVRLANCVGVIDSDYRGEILVKLVSDYLPRDPFNIKQGDRIAQAMLIPVEHVRVMQVTHLSQTKRSDNGFGSTGG